MKKLFKHLLVAVGYGLLGGILMILGGYIYLLENRPDLSIWHEVQLHSEFTAAEANEVLTLDDYLATEQRVMQELETKIYDRIPAADKRDLVRYHRGSLMDPTSRPVNWNRTFVMAPENPVAGALLIHGLSDSPYSMRAIAEVLFEHDVLVLGLRMPGHGTAPSGLLGVRWQDFVAATRIGIRHLQHRLGDAPVYLFGYSNGAALAVEYALGPLEGVMVPQVDGLVLFSPAMGVAPVAALARWQGELGQVTGLNKLAWSSIQLEFDPYKYNSFTVNAGDQIFRLTNDIDRRINALASAHGLKYFPKTLAFQSVVDATVPPNAAVDRFFSKFDEPGGHELVLFDVNRNTETEPLLRSDPESLVNTLLEQPTLPFDLSLITNVDPQTDEVMVRVKLAESPFVLDQPLGVSWPNEVFSMSHVALPFTPDDPLYGTSHVPGDTRITLGSVNIQGERNLLQIPDSFFIRLRHNPFFDYMMQRILEFLDLEQAREN